MLRSAGIVPFQHDSKNHHIQSCMFYFQFSLTHLTPKSKLQSRGFLSFPMFSPPKQHLSRWCLSNDLRTAPPPCFDVGAPCHGAPRLLWSCLTMRTQETSRGLRSRFAKYKWCANRSAPNHVKMIILCEATMIFGVMHPKGHSWLKDIQEFNHIWCSFTTIENSLRVIQFKPVS